MYVNIVIVLINSKNTYLLKYLYLLVVFEKQTLFIILVKKFNLKCLYTFYWLIFKRHFK